MPQGVGSAPLETIVQRMIDAGEPEANIASVIQAYKPPSTPAPGRTPESMAQRWGWASTPDESRAGVKNMQRVALDNAPLLGGMLAAPLTGGLAIPAAMAAEGGAQATGALVRGVAHGDSAKDTAVSAGENFLGGGALAGVGRSAPLLKDQAGKMWTRLAKPTDAVLKTTNAAKGGDLPAGAREIAETVLSQGRGTLRSGNAEALRSGLDTLDDSLKSAIASSSATVPRAALERALLDEAQRVGTGSIAQATKQRALETAFDHLQTLPNDIPVQTAQGIKQQIYATRNYAAGAKDAADAAADKVTGRALRSEIATAEPSVAPINDELSRQIPASKAMSAAVKRSGNRDVIKLSQLLAMVKPSPFTMGSAVLNDPLAGSFVAQQMYNGAQYAAQAPQALRAALIGLLGTHQP